MKVDNTILAVLSGASTDGRRLVLAGTLDRKTYVAADKVLQAAGGKWNTKAKAHLFDSDAAERIGQIIITGDVDIPKDKFNYFPTPAAVVSRMLSIAGNIKGKRVLEPEAGKGAIAMPAAVHGATVDCIELMDANYAALCALGKFLNVKQADFLAVEPAPLYDLVLMNPPFAKQADIKHVNHALKFLKPAGLLVAIMSAGVSFRDNKLTQDFRVLVRERGGDIDALPEGYFKESGTLVNTVVVTIPGTRP